MKTPAKLWAGAALMALALLGPPLRPAAASTTTGAYRLTDMGVPIGYTDFAIHAVSINAGGMMSGAYTTPGGAIHAFRWTPSAPNGTTGTLQDLGTLSGDTDSGTSAINAAGHIAGISKPASGPSHAVRYDATGFHDLGVQGGNGLDINSSDTVVGLKFYQANSGGTQHAVIFPSSGGSQDIGLLAPNGADSLSVAVGINDSGKTVGLYLDADGHVIGFRYAPGDSVLHSLRTFPDGVGSQSAAINAAGAIAGGADHADGNFHATLYQNGNASELPQDLGVLPGLDASFADGLNASQQVVGQSFTADFSTVRGFVWSSSGGMQNLNEMLDSSGAGYTVIGARGINDRGQIAGIAVTPNGETHPVLLTPVAAALNVTSQFSFSAGGFRYNRANGHFLQTVTLTNQSGATVTGPLSLALDSLSSNASLANASGRTSAASPAGSPYITVSSADVPAGSGVTVTLDFTNPSRAGIGYTPRVLAGSGAR